MLLRVTVLYLCVSAWSFISLTGRCCLGQEDIMPVHSGVKQDQGGVGSFQPLVLVHYMPWYEAKPLSQQWGWHWTMNHFNPDKVVDQKREIASKYYPAIGPYDSGDTDVIEYHLLLMKLCGIDGVIVDWYGLTSYRDYAILHRNTTRVLQACERLKMKFAICYEDQTIPLLSAAGELNGIEPVDHAVGEINWLSRYWFQSPSYVRLGKKPLLLSFGHDGLSPQQWGQCVKRLSAPVCYYSQDILRSGAHGGFNWPSPREGINQYDEFLKRAEHWPSFIPVAFPRFDDIYDIAKVSDGFPVIPDRSGATLKQTLKKCIDSGAEVFQIATWNDWGEGTQIEPSIEHGQRDLKIIQAFLQNHYGRVLSVQPSDLKLPREILDLQRSSQPPAVGVIKSVIEAIDRGEITRVREILQNNEGR